jgi:uncharacterized membrane protein YbhN (UPF0104 family)
MSRRLLAGVLFGALVYVGILLWSDVGAIGAALSDIPLRILPAALACSCVNYLLRFWKWERFRRALGIDLDARTSFQIFLSGLGLGVTPGKMGELIKAWMLKRAVGVPIHRSAPIVIAERLTDLLAFLVLMGVGGLASHPELAWLFWGVLGACSALVVALGSERFERGVLRLVGRLPYVHGMSDRLSGSFESLRELCRPRQLILPTLVSIASWSAECVGFWLVADALVPEQLSLSFAVFAYAAGALFGAVLVFLPGEIGAAEWSLGTLLRPEYARLGGYARDLARAKAAAAVLLARLCTLWFGVAIGLVAMGFFQRRFGRVEPGQDA